MCISNPHEQGGIGHENVLPDGPLTFTSAEVSGSGDGCGCGCGSGVADVSIGYSASVEGSAVTVGAVFDGGGGSSSGYGSGSGYGPGPDSGWGCELTYEWHVTGGEDKEEYCDSGSNYSWNFTPKEEGNYTVELAVFDEISGDYCYADPITFTVAEAPLTVALSQPVRYPDGSVSTTATVQDAGQEPGYKYAWTVTRNGSYYTSQSGTNPTFQFTPNAYGTYVVSVTASERDDDQQASASTAFTQPLTAIPQSYTTLKNFPLKIDAPGLTAGNEPAGQLGVVYIQDQLPKHGTLQIWANGAFIYTPVPADYVGPDSFGYETYILGSCPVVYSQPATVSLYVSNISVTDVSFSGNGHFEVTPDPNNPVTAFIVPEWEAGSPGRQYPVGYSIGSTMTAYATLTLDTAWSGNPIYVCAVTSTDVGMWTEWTPATVGDTAVLVNVNFNNKAFDSVADYNTMNIEWYATVVNPSDPLPDATSIHDDAGMSSNRAYVTYQAPSGPLYETCLKIGCDAAAGTIASATPQAVVNSVWTGFSGLSVSRADGTQLKYWHGGAADATDSGGLIKDANGQCGAWAALFVDTLSAQGISGAQKIYVESTYKDDPRVSRVPGVNDDFYRGLMLVKSWTFPATGTAPADVAPFDYRLAEVTDQTGVAGQGNPNPPGAFYNHFIVEYDSVVNGSTVYNYYDPSYGGSIYSNSSQDVAHAAWEDASLDGFATWQVTTDPVTHVSSAILVAKKNAPGVGAGGANLETTFSPTSHS